MENILPILDGTASIFQFSNMDQKLWKFIGAPECGKCNTGTLFKGAHQFSEAVTLKTERIEKAGLSATSLLPDVYLFRDLVRDALSHRYNELSLLAFTHICVALDYFLTVIDERHDHLPAGLLDDIQVINRTREKFKDEIEGYLKWRKQNH